MRAELASKRSIDAIRRLNIPVDGGKLAEVVLDILVPFFSGSDALRGDGANLGIPNASAIPLFAWQQMRYCNAT